MRRLGHWTMYGQKRHLMRWLEYQLPVLLVLYDPEEHAAYWQHVNPDTARLTPEGFKITIPAAQRLDARCRQQLRSLAESWKPSRPTAGSMALQAIATCQAAGIPVPATAKLWDSIVGTNRRWSSSPPALAHRLPLRGDAPAVAAVAAAAAHDPAHLSIRALRGLWTVDPGTSIYVCENQVVIHAVANQLGASSRPLVLLGGFPSPAVEYLLIGLAASGARLKVHVDHDDTGSRIADSLFLRSVTFERWCPNTPSPDPGHEEQCLPGILRELGLQQSSRTNHRP
jgi:hypothetical protein